MCMYVHRETTQSQMSKASLWLENELQYQFWQWLWKGQGKPREEVQWTAWEMWNRNGFTSERVTSNSWSPFASEFVEYADKVGRYEIKELFWFGEVVV